MRGIEVSRRINEEELIQMECDSILNDISQQEAEKRALQQAIDENKTRLKQAQAKLSELRKRKKQTDTRNSEMSEDFDNGTYPWSQDMTRLAKKNWNISSFRHCQRGACNAGMSGRDVICIMPTGGGKSLIYQLPALMMAGCTLVISPLISLIMDQYLHLCDAGVESMMISGSSSDSKHTKLYNRLLSSVDANSGVPEVKICFATPEKISKSKRFMSVLQKLHDKNRLARIVIDEAHCVSQLGHDFRPDYRALGRLREHFSSVPILCLSATCPPSVRDDLIKILKMQPISPTGTVLFQAPLYRPNLHYSVLPKPSNANALIKAMVGYILENHPKDTGIVYCFSRKDAENVRDGLQEVSEGKIRAGTYHSDIGDEAKERLHVDWREGKIKVVCATIAFGLGIDKGDKSLDGYYQESGRAGRDGKDSDCVLYYRPQDFMNICGLISAEQKGMEKLVEMARFTQDYSTCRKIGFARYFLESSHIEIESWSTSVESVHDRCGHCDNCTRDPATVEAVDVTTDAYKIIRAVQHISSNNVRMTMSALVSMVRGKGKKTAESSSGGRGQKVDVEIDIEKLVQGKVKMNGDDTEQMICHLIIENNLSVYPVATAHKTNIYIKPGARVHRISRLPENGLDELNMRIKCNFLRDAKKVKVQAETKTKKRKRASGAAGDDDDEDGSEAEADPRPRQKAKEEALSDREDFGDDGPKTRRRAAPRRSSGKATASRRKTSPSVSVDDDEVIDLVSEEDDIGLVPGPSRSTTNTTSTRNSAASWLDDENDDDGDEGFITTSRTLKGKGKGRVRRILEEDDDDDIEGFEMDDAVLLDALPFQDDGEQEDDGDLEGDSDSDGGIDTGFQFNLRGSRTKPP